MLWQCRREEGQKGKGMEGEIQREMGEDKGGRERERETLVRTLQTPAASL